VKTKNTSIAPISVIPNDVDRNPLVSVVIHTFNQKDFISKTIEGALSQKTNFSFEIILGDDESNDGTRELCLKYAESNRSLIRLILHNRENVIYFDGMPSGRFNWVYNMSIANGKYIALCDGDDYWKDCYKLQKQVDFLETNPDYGLVHTDVDILDSKNNIQEQYYTSREMKWRSGEVYEDLMSVNYAIQTSTAVFVRKLVQDKLLDIDDKLWSFYAGDVPLWLELARLSKIKYIPSVTTCRRHTRPGGLHIIDSSKRMGFKKSLYECRKYFGDKYFWPASSQKKSEYWFANEQIRLGYKIHQKNEVKSGILKLISIRQLKIKHLIKYLVSRFF
jgi:glycosyltransferase involved in cell wall biosynthesis